MNAYRLSIKTYCKARDASPLAIDLAVNLPTEQLTPLLAHHRLDEEGVASGVLATRAEAFAAHNDLIYLVQLVDALELTPVEDQRGICRNRKLGRAFDRPIILVDSAGSIAVLSRRKPSRQNNPLSEFGWVTEPLYGPGFSDGSTAQISSQELDVSELAERVEWGLS